MTKVFWYKCEQCSRVYPGDRKHFCFEEATDTPMITDQLLTIWHYGREPLDELLTPSRS